ncbi:4-hydroxy-3-methylbut-2-enyl diphosphate reductase [archaeon]|nr:4-hydroxy-3-methylbut-2-enyl diphosphate reductase [archaeon]MBL7057170.1 4-hydroxy-3-methylbut-2-enyl diphosphate reductase [Candidatus Woesearchaeota archaeon]
MKKIILASPRGFCGGVSRAVDIVERTIDLFGSPVYVNHEIVHNEFVVNDLKGDGAVFVDSLDEVPEKATLIFSAHGVPPTLVKEAKKKDLKIIDATCPLVTKVHLEAIRFHKQGYSIVLIGKKNHQEVIGTMGEAPMQLVGKVEDVKKLKIPNPDKVAYIMQTTLSVDETKEIVRALKDKFPKIISPEKDDICYATQNRQNAVKELTKKADLILVVGSHNSSNSNRLAETAKQQGVKSYLIPDKAAIKDEWFENVKAVGITSGASVPEVLVKEVVLYLEGKFEGSLIEQIKFTEENVKFPIPRELRKK